MTHRRFDFSRISQASETLQKKQGVKNICIHKGLPFPGDPEWWSPMDVTKAAKDFPNLNFLVYHSGFKGPQESLAAAKDEFRKTTYVPWTSDLCAWKKKNADVKNIYMEMGSTFALMISTNPLLASYVMGMIIDAFGADHVLWGTDSIWYGTPRKANRSRLDNPLTPIAEGTMTNGCCFRCGASGSAMKRDVRNISVPTIFTSILS